MTENPPHPLAQLSDTDKDLVVQFILASGSLKDLAAHYGVSYPTVRNSLDRLITNLKAVLAGQPHDPMAGFLADMVEKGDVSAGAARRILAYHRTSCRHGEER